MFNLNIWLSSNDSDIHDSAIFRVVFSKPGLVYNGYDWQAPYLKYGENGSTDDDSDPIITDLPIMLDADILSGVGYPAGVVDVELSNAADDNFSTGLLATLSIEVPESWGNLPDSIIIDVIPDTFADGFSVIPTTSGPSFTVNIPEPASLSLVALGSLCLWRRKN
jgi:hypothetical protein